MATSLYKAWGNARTSNVTLDWWRWASVNNQATHAAIQHSLMYAAAAATTVITVLVVVTGVCQHVEIGALHASRSDDPIFL